MADREQQQLRNRLIELARKSYDRGIYTYTPFLSLAEQQVFYETEKEVAYAGCAMEGGTPECERKMIRFGNRELLGYGEDYPIAALFVTPVRADFAEKLTHRDYLGALMNLGIARGLLGDLFPEQGGCILFCQKSIVPFLTDNLTQVRHTRVKCSETDAADSLKAPDVEEVLLSVSSARIDGIVSKVYNMARSHSLELFKAGRVFVNGRLMENNSYFLKEQDAVTVRGFGRFTYKGVRGETRKGRERAVIEVYR